MGKPEMLMGIRGTIDERGRIVIPKHLLEELGLEKGDMIVFERWGSIL
jgi:AbrB family looped-hinge helix DNA binding protein